MNLVTVKKHVRTLLPCLVALAAFGLIGSDAFAQTGLIPDLGAGLNIKTLVEEAVVVIATAVGACVAAYFAFLAVKIALKYANKVGG